MKKNKNGKCRDFLGNCCFGGHCFYVCSRCRFNTGCNDCVIENCKKCSRVKPFDAMMLANLLNLTAPVFLVGYTFNSDIVRKVEYSQGHFIIYCGGKNE